MFRFTIRELLLLMLVVALGAGWWISHRRSAAELREAKAQYAAYVGSAENWRKIALTFAHLMREDGWYVSVDEDGTGWGYTSRHNIGRETADELNNKKPLPAVNSLLVLPAD